MLKTTLLGCGAWQEINSLTEDHTKIVVVSGDGAEVWKGLVNGRSQNRSCRAESDITVSVPVQHFPTDTVVMGVVLLEL